MYTEASLDRIREADIVQLIGNYVDLKKSGSNYKGLSPFKDEKTASFMVSPVKNIFKCFASGEGGDGIKFIQLIERVSFYEAVKIISDKCGIYLEQEEMTEEKKEKAKTNQDIKSLAGVIARKYSEELKNLPEDHWAKEMIKKRGFSPEVVIDFNLGFAPRNFVSQQVVKMAKLELAKEIGVVKVKNGVSYDFFQERLVFPIHDRNGQILSFGGRRSNAEDQQSYAKYLNGPQSQIYDKSKVLYGLHQAVRSIAKKREAILVEGYTDVISLHQSGADNTVATCGTALTYSHAQQLKRLAEHIILFRDGDTAGMNAVCKDIQILLPCDIDKISVVIAPEGEDPDSIAQKHDVTEFISHKSQDALIWLAEYYLSQAETEIYQKAVEAGTPEKELKKIERYDISLKASVLENYLDILAMMPSALKRNEYLKSISKIFGQNIGTLKKTVNDILSQIASKEKREAEANGFSKKELASLPEGANLDEYREKGFVTIGNEFWIKTKKEGWTWATNFKMTPLFHIKGGDDTPRLFDVISSHNPPKRALVEITSSEVLNYTAMQNKLLNHAVFRWNVCVDTIEFKTIMVNLIEECIEAKPFYYFGWQSKGFWAFANGIYLNEHFHEVNKYGIVVAEGLEEVDSEYYDNTPNYYSPAFNETNKYNDDGEDEYENDRTFIYKKSPVSLNRWMEQMAKVYGSKGNIAIAFSLATMFRDFILSRYSFFPHLFLTGEKEAGKSKYGNSIAKVFFHGLPPFDLNSGTLVGFYRRLARNKNVPTFFEEYHDKIDDRMFQSLKGAFDGRGREKGMMTDNNRTSISQINSSCIIASQYNSTRDDNSLTSRSITMSFIKPASRSQEQVEAFNLLQKWEEEGLSSMILEVIQYRKLFEQNFHEAFAKNAIKFKKALERFEFQERIMGNYNAIYTPVEILYNELKFPFTLEEFFAQCVNGIVDNSDLLVESEGLSEFWNIVQALYEEKYQGIHKGIHFDLDVPPDTVINPKKNEKITWKNSDRKKLLFLRLNMVHQKYSDIASKRDGVDVIGEGSLRNNFKSKRYFIGPKHAHRFTRRDEKGSKVSKVSNCYVFDYDMMKELEILNLDDPESVGFEHDDDNPFT